MSRNQSNKTTLTDKQKFELCQYARDNKEVLEAYVEWIKARWNVTVHKSTVSRILKDSHKRLNEDITTLTLIRNGTNQSNFLSLSKHLWSLY